MSNERDEAVARFMAIHEECKGHWWKSWMAMPQAMRACRDIFQAGLKERLEKGK